MKIIKKSIIAAVIITIALIILTGCGNKTAPGMSVSTYSNGKSQIWSYDLNKKSWTKIVDDRNVMLNGFESMDKKNVYFLDTPDGEAYWQVFRQVVGNKEPHKITQNQLPKGYLNNGPNGECYYIQPDPNQKNMNRVFMIDPSNQSEKSGSETSYSVEYDMQNFCVSNDGIIGAMYSRSEFEKKVNDAEEGFVPLDYSIVGFGKNGKTNTILKIKAGNIDSLSIDKTGKKLLIAGQNQARGYFLNIYDLKTGKLIRGIPESEIIGYDNKIGSIMFVRIIAEFGPNENELFFSGIPTDTESMDSADFKATSMAIYRFDLRENKIERIDQFKKTLITDIKY